MNKKYKKILILLAIIVFGFIIYKYFLTNQKVHILKKFSTTGQLLGTNEYFIRNGEIIFDGSFVKYNEKGIKISEGQFVNNEPYGLCTYYYDSGNIESVFYRKNSKINLECTYYNVNGLIETYIMCDDFGKTSFIINFDDKGVRNYEGYPLLETYQYAYKDQLKIKKEQDLKIGDTLRYNYIVANIPNTKRSFTIENVGIDNTTVKRILNKVPPTQINVSEILTKKGKNTIKSTVKYEFNDKVTPVFTFIHSFDVIVN